MRTGLLLITLLLASSLANAASCPAPPSGWGPQWWSTYKSWCRACGGNICNAYNDCGGRCDLPGATSGADSMAGMTPGEMIGTALGQVVACKVFNACPPGMERSSDNAEARAEYYSMGAAQRAKIDAADAQHRNENAAAQDSVRQAMAIRGGLALRDLDIKDDLVTVDKPGAFGANQPTPWSLVPHPDVVFPTSTFNVIEQLDCAEQLLHRAADLSSTFDQETRADLSMEAVHYIDGVPAHVHCLPTPGFAVAKDALNTRRTDARADAVYYERLMRTYAARAVTWATRQRLAAERTAAATSGAPVAEIDKRLDAMDRDLANADAAVVALNAGYRKVRGLQ